MSRKIETVNDFLTQYRWRGQKDPIPYDRYTETTRDTGYYGLYLRLFRFSDQITVEFEGEFKGKSFAVEKSLNWSFNQGLILSVYNHFALQRFLPNYPRLYSAFVTPEELIQIKDVPGILPGTQEINKLPDLVSTAFDYFEQLDGKLRLLSLPKFCIYHRTLIGEEARGEEKDQEQEVEYSYAFDDDVKMEVVGGCIHSSEEVCLTYQENTFSAYQKVRNFLLFIIHLYLCGCLPERYRQLLTGFDGLESLQNSFISIDNYITLTHGFVPEGEEKVYWERYREIIRKAP